MTNSASQTVDQPIEWIHVDKDMFLRNKAINDCIRYALLGLHRAGRAEQPAEPGPNGERLTKYFLKSELVGERRIGVDGTTIFVIKESAI